MPIKAALGNMPFAGNVADSLELMRKVWGVAGLPTLPSAVSVAQLAQTVPQMPSMMMPTLDIGELDKRITDLRAVEQWLALNANMLRTTIQTLEVQRNTLATLKSFGAAMLSPMANAKAQRDSAGAQAQAAAASAPAAAPAPNEDDETSNLTEGQRRRAAQARAAEGEKKVPTPFEAPLNPAAWWGTLQDQFARVASSAAATAAQATQKPAPKTAAKATRRRRPRKKAAPVSSE
jgi:hypothetical protein